MNTSSSSGNFTLSASGNIALNGTVTAGGGGVFKTTTGGQLVDNAPGDVINAGTIILNAGSKGIGTSTAPLQFSNGTSALTLTANSTGSIILNDGDSAALTLAGSTTSKSFTLTAPGAGGINVTGAVATTAASVSLSSAGGNITSSGTGLINGKTVTLSAGGAGTIGGATALSVNAASLAGAAGGLLTVNDVNKGSTSLLNSASGGTFTVTTAGATTLHNITATGTITVTDSSGALQTAGASGVLPGALISSTNGGITLENSNTKSGSIVIGLDSTIQTGPLGHNIYIGIGNPGAGVAGKTPTFVTPTKTGTGTIFFGTTATSTITAVGPQNFVNAINAQVFFNTGPLKSTAIKLNGSDTITADPPSPSGLLTVPTASPSGAEMGTPSSGADMGPHASSVLNLSAPTTEAGWKPALPGFVASAEPGFANTAPSGTDMGAHASSVLLPLPTDEAGWKPALPGAYNLTSMLNGSAAVDASWLSETELATGQIPAVLDKGDQFGIEPIVSTVVEMREKHASTAANVQREVALNKGSVLFAPDADTTVTTRFGTVKMSAGSLVLVIQTRDGLSVFDMDDQHNASVTVTSAGRTFALYPGMHVSVAGQSISEFADINPAEHIGYRNIKTTELADGLKAFTAEFSLHHAMAAVIPLHQLAVSKNPRAGKVAAHLLKTAVILMRLNNGQYLPVERPGITAYQAN